MKFRRLGLAAGLVLASALAAQPATAQQRDTAALRRQAEQQLGQDLSQDDIVRRLQESGMTRSQVRARLQALGYDPGLADTYFDAIDAGVGSAPPAAPSGELLQAMERLGLPDSAAAMLTDSVLANATGRDSLLLVLDSLLADSARLDSLRREARLPIFGMELFSGENTQFTPLTWGPVGPDYQLGPGDQLVLILTGDVETAYDLEVTREGFVVIPDVGRVQVAGLTLGQLEQRLYGQLAEVYSGVETETTSFQVSLGELRTNEVYIVGEVQRPGAYQVSGVATVLNALYQANGPNREGSFRSVQVRRGNELVSTVDLYEYLLTGASRSDVTLRNGDRIFVPLVQRRVAIDGQVRRTARYEMKPGETLSDLIAFAGGFRPEAVVSRVQIDRVLPPEERRPGVDRVLIDVPVTDVDDTSIELRDGDLVTVFAISDERRNRVAAAGEVRRPGVYQWLPGMTLRQLIERAGGLSETAFGQRAQIFRLNEATNTRVLIPASLDVDAAGNAIGPDVRLADRDSVMILSRSELAVPDSVEIAGFVKNPGRYEMALGMSVQDLILAAGGFVEGANLVEAELARLPDPTRRTDTTAIVYRIPLADSASAAEAARVGADRMVPNWVTAADGTPLEPSDRVLIGRAPGYEPPRTIVVTGEVRRPGPYALTDRETRITDVIARAGGLTGDAHAAGFHLVRDSLVVGTDLEEALEDPEDPENILVLDGDSLHVPRYEDVVHVTGAVAFESRVRYEPGAGLGHYIEQAGGYSANADRRRTSVTMQSGERETVDRFLFFTRYPEPGPGSVVFVPALPPEAEATGVRWTDVVRSTATIVGTVATVVYAYIRLSE